MAKRKDKHSKNGGDSPERMKRKDYEEKLHKLHIKLSQLQEWVKQKGLRVIIAFEGRDAAGKGGTIRAITERVSPRVFRVVALPAPSERQKTQLFMQRYIEQFPAAGEIVIFDRSWYNRAGVEHVMGFVSEEGYRRFLKLAPRVRKIYCRRRDHSHQVLAGSRQGRAGTPFPRPHQRSDATVEIESHGYRVVQALVRLFKGARYDARHDRQQRGAMVRNPL